MGGVGESSLASTPASQHIVGYPTRAVQMGNVRTISASQQQQAMAAAVPRMVFGDELAQIKMPSRLAGGGWDGQKWQGWLSPASVDRGHLPNKPHMDGGSELKSDYFLMFCGQCANTGGDYIGSGGDGGSILLDGYDILDSLPQQQRSDFFTVPTQSRGYVEGGR